VAWGDHLARPECTGIFSRVVEKTQEYTVACTIKLLSLYDLTNVETITIYMDTGPHYRAYRFISSMTLYITETLHRSAQFVFLTEHHGKGRVDALFARVTQAIDNACQRTMLKDIADVVLACQAWRAESTTGASTDRFIDFVPCPKIELPIQLLLKSCFPVTIKSAYTFKFNINDARRKTLRGRFPKEHVLTGLTATCHVLKELASASYLTFYPELDMNFARKRAALKLAASI
jgi:hypothetical protein